VSNFKEKLRPAKIVVSVGLRFLLKKPMVTRVHLPILLQLLNLTGEGAEIGVSEGAFSEAILTTSSLSILYSVDPWKEFDKSIYDDITSVSAAEHEKRYETTVRKLSPFGKRSNLLRLTSAEAAKLYKSETLDFVYIDANHSYEECRKDIGLWFPKLKKGGIFAGHDYLDGNLPEGNFGVKRAVDEFVAKSGQFLFVSTDKYPTWYLVKNMRKLNYLSIVYRVLKNVLPQLSNFDLPFV
jgi:hypothetical protein